MIDACWWRIKNRVSGHAQSVLVSAEIVGLPSPLQLTRLALGPAMLSDTNGVGVWLLQDSDLKRLATSIKSLPAATLISCPRIQTASGIVGSMWTGETPSPGQNVGVGMDCVVRTHWPSVDLKVAFSFTEVETNDQQDTWPASSTISVRTILAIAARLQFTDRNGALLLKSNGTGKSIALLISPVVKTP
jgi:hypothetical protein